MVAVCQKYLAISSHVQYVQPLPRLQPMHEVGSLRSGEWRDGMEHAIAYEVRQGL